MRLARGVAVWGILVALCFPRAQAANFWNLEPESRIIAGVVQTDRGTGANGQPYMEYVLIPDRPLGISADGMAGEHAAKIQLAAGASGRASLASAVGRRVSVTGTVYVAYNENHHTPLVMLVSAITLIPTVAGFSDVYETDYYAAPVQWALRRGITTGTTSVTFSPEAGCTVAQGVTFLWRASGSPAPTIPNLIRDLDETEYYYKPALWAYENGLISGFTFSEETLCSRGQVINWLWKLEGSPVVGSNPFVDVPFGASCARAVAWALEKGVTSGTAASSFQPEAVCTRGQMVTFLYRNR